MQYQVFIQNSTIGEASPEGSRTLMASVVSLPNITANGITEKEAIDFQQKATLDCQHGDFSRRSDI